MATNKVPLKDENGKLLNLMGIGADIAGQKKHKLQLLQVQKMETIGRLAGVIAHDFNNLLTVIINSCDLLMDTWKECKDQCPGKIRLIRDASARGARLIQQLLAFSRKQIMQAKKIQLNDLISELHELLARLSGEKISVELDLHEHLPSIVIDPIQFQQVLLNLIVNSVEAMPSGGTIVISTSLKKIGRAEKSPYSDLPPGRYVSMQVRDMGTGMSDEVKAHIFEPFFTTKENGTGLGLATVQGIVKHSRGSCSITSKEGAGTLIQILLPAQDGEAAGIQGGQSVQGGHAGTEAIMVVEDEEDVRQLLCEVLAMNGYRVTSFNKAEDALAFLQCDHRKIQLVITDVVLPGISGLELSAALRASHPRLQVLFISGYNENLIAREIKRQPGFHFLHKPFHFNELMAKIRQMLDPCPYHDGA
ncbi:MAG: response regulator [Candidatus Aminicenantes bacterium]|nr:response regulator [Candidatus Aminicenantes bacterium]